MNLLRLELRSDQVNEWWQGFPHVESTVQTYQIVKPISLKPFQFYEPTKKCDKTNDTKLLGSRTIHISFHLPNYIHNLHQIDFSFVHPMCKIFVQIQFPHECGRLYTLSMITNIKGLRFVNTFSKKQVFSVRLAKFLLFCYVDVQSEQKYLWICFWNSYFRIIYSKLIQMGFCVSNLILNIVLIKFPIKLLDCHDKHVNSR